SLSVGARLWLPVLYLVGVAVYATARWALLPAAAADALLPSSRAVGWIGAAGAAGIGACITLVSSVPAIIDNGRGILIGSAAMNVVAAISAFAAIFPSDSCKQLTAGRALARFFVAADAIVKNRRQVARLLAQGVFLSLSIAAFAALLQFASTAGSAILA